ncbi:MAG: 2-C-methyl-D-erythritol 4-phosphate cytidylyltransferase [Lentisphaeria bacterium]|nr:2-C-methyl-D-erythritol 4-phosphate cytidylyltransferase [Lentisphaeria bacterium]
MIPDLGVIIAAGGSSQRYGEKDKLLEELAGLPVFLHSIRNFLPLTAPGNLIVAVRSGALAMYRNIAEKFLPQASVVWVAGGSDRVKSVTNALNALALQKGFVAIHDAARPLASAALLKKVLERARMSGGAIAANPVADSLKLADENGMIAAPVSRDRVFHAETPQIFDLEKYRAACRALNGVVPTDDAEIMRLSGFPVELVDSGQWNMKLTSPGDLEKLRMMLAGGGNE